MLQCHLTVRGPCHPSQKKNARESRGTGQNEETNEAPSSRMSTKRRRTGQSSSRSGAAREPPQQLLPDDIERENAAVLNKLPREVWEKVVGSLRERDFFPFALTCRCFRDLRQDAEALELERITDPRDTPSSYGVSTRTTLTTTLESYSYISTWDFHDELYSSTIDGGKYPLLPRLLLWLLSLTTLCLTQSLVAVCSPPLLNTSSGSSGR